MVRFRHIFEKPPFVGKSMRLPKGGEWCSPGCPIAEGWRVVLAGMSIKLDDLKYKIIREPVIAILHRAMEVTEETHVINKLRETVRGFLL
jgi:hypothetical protein